MSATKGKHIKLQDGGNLWFCFNVNADSSTASLIYAFSLHCFIDYSPFQRHTNTLNRHILDEHFQPVVDKKKSLVSAIF